MSRHRMPKHLLKLFSDRTLLEEAVRRLESLLPPENVFVLTNALQLARTRKALAGVIPASQVIAEPAKRDTAPAAALATALARGREGDGATLALLPADAHIADHGTFGRQLGCALERADRCGTILTVAVRPTHPSTAFGYLELGAERDRGRGGVIREVRRFVEKPDLRTARKYLARGSHAWNAGMFCWKVATFLGEADRNAPALSRFVREFPLRGRKAYLASRFPKLPKISVDYAIMEKASRVETLLAQFDWDDVGLWTALQGHLPNDENRNALRGRVVLSGAGNNIAVATGRTIALCGVSDLVVVETADAVLVCHRNTTGEIKRIVRQLPTALR